MSHNIKDEHLSSDENSSESDSEMETEQNEVEDEEEESGQQSSVSRTYIPNNFNKDEELVCDESVYVVYQKAETGYPCLSFDVIDDNLGSGEERANNYPLSCYLVAGTQANKVHVNQLMVLKMSNIHKVKHKNEDNSESDDESSDSEDEDTKPELECAPVGHQGCVNRVRCTSINNKCFSATWSELGRVFIWDLTQPLKALDDVEAMTHFTRNKVTVEPIFTFTGHRIEGFALDWSALKSGMLATGDCSKNIFIWKPLESGQWFVDQQPLIGHLDSVEDLQWSPNEENVMASCSVDKTIRIWDIRARQSSSCMLTVDNAHDSDVNVISWNKLEKAFIVSGGDDGVIKIWDLRQFKSKSAKPIATFKHHISHITSVEWHPTDSTVFAASGNDNQLTLWDLAVEKDNDREEAEKDEQQTELNELPPQLLFIHQGQKEIKEIHWHKDIPGLVISTALNGFDIFRTISV
jgi:ribosome assembly protein RRB1